MSSIKSLLAILFCFFLLVQISFAEKGKVYFLEFIFNESGFYEKSVDVIEGSVININGLYKYELVSFDDKVLETLFFNVRKDEIIHRHTNLPNETPKSEDITSPLNEGIVIGNYFHNGKTINIYYPDSNKILSVDVGYLAEVCGDAVCQPHESFFECSKDCLSGSKDDYCDEVKDDICDSDCVIGRDADCGDEDKGFNLLFLIIPLVLINAILIGFLLFKFVIKKPKTSSPLPKQSQGPAYMAPRAPPKPMQAQGRMSLEQEKKLLKERIREKEERERVFREFEK